MTTRDPTQPPTWDQPDDSGDQSRREERADVSAEVAARLNARGVALTGHETSEQLVELLDAVERFEHAVERHGGDLMVDEGPRGTTREPDDVHFVLPRREANESITSYRQRVEKQTRNLRHHPDSPSDREAGETFP